MAAVSLSAPAHYESGIDFAGNDTRKALNARAYYEATEHGIVSVQVREREC